MEQRIKYQEKYPNLIKGMLVIENHIHKSNLDKSLYELVKFRASQINGCAYCIDMHTKDARANGETEQRLYALTAWRETSFYTDKERAALEWTEELTLIAENHAPDSLYEHVSNYFNEKEMVALSMAIIAINGWNRLAIGFRTEPGTYEAK